MPMVLPLTRTHRQLANWINEQELVDERRRPVIACVTKITTNTDRLIPGSRLRVPGRGRQGLRLEIKPAASKIFNEVLYQHDASGTYRRHAEARAWVEQRLRRKS